MKLFSIFLLLSFTLVLTPKTWWHHCKHATHTSKTEHTHEQTLDDDCPICDLSLSVYTNPSPFNFQAAHQAPIVLQSVTQAAVFKLFIPIFQLRAPPSISV